MGSKLHEVDFKSLEVIDDGKLNVAFRKHIQRVCQDCQDRPTEPKARKVMVEVEFSPVLEPDGDASDAWMKFSIKSSIPDHRSKAYSVGMRRNNMFVFSEHSVEDVNQETLEFNEDN